MDQSSDEGDLDPPVGARKPGQEERRREKTLSRPRKENAKIQAASNLPDHKILCRICGDGAVK